MLKYFLRLGKYFDSSVIHDRDKKGLRRVAEESSEGGISKFQTLENYILSYNAHIGKGSNEIPNFSVHTIPLIINRLPVWYEHPAGNLLIGNVEVEGEK